MRIRGRHVVPVLSQEHNGLVNRSLLQVLCFLLRFGDADGIAPRFRVFHITVRMSWYFESTGLYVGRRYVLCGAHLLAAALRADSVHDILSLSVRVGARGHARRRRPSSVWCGVRHGDFWGFLVC